MQKASLRGRSVLLLQMATARYWRWAVRLRARDLPTPDNPRSCLVVAPHPDDETFGCAALIARRLSEGATVDVLVLTDGSRSHPEMPRQALADLRRGELLQACGVLGVDPTRIHLLQLPDGALAAHLNRAIDELQRLVLTVKPQEVLVTSGFDGHPDHVAASQAAREALRERLDIALLEYPVWSWFRGPLAAFEGQRLSARLIVSVLSRLVFAPRSFAISTPEYRDVKAQATSAYGTQLGTSAAGLSRSMPEGFVDLFTEGPEIFFSRGRPVQWVRRPDGPPLRVLHVLPDLAIGGGQRLVLALAHALEPEVQVEVAYLSGRHELLKEFEDHGFEVHELPAGGVWQQVRAVRGLVRLVRRGKFDVLHAHSSADKRVTQVAGLVVRRPVVAHLHVWRNHAQRDRGLEGRLRATGRALFGLATVRCYVAISESVMTVNWPAVPGAARRLVLIRNGIQLERFEAAQPVGREELGLEVNDPLILWVGRLSAEKDVPSLLRMMEALGATNPSARLLVVGDGTRRSEIEAQIETLGLSETVLMLGNRSDVPSLMATADLFVFASISEGFGLAVAEAQAAGLPVVAFSIPAVAEIVEDGITGTLVSRRDPQQLAEAVAALLDDPVQRQLMGDAARGRAHALFDIKSTAAQLRSLYESLVGRASV